MEDNNKSTSEFENLVKEATGEIPTVSTEKDDDIVDIQIVDDQPTIEEKEKEPSVEEKESVEVTYETQEEKPKLKTEDIQVVDDGTSVVLPQTKDGGSSTIPASVENSTPDSHTIGTIKPDKQKSPIAMLVLFGGLIAFIIFMPTAVDLFNKYFGTDLNLDSLNNPQYNENNNNDATKEEKDDNNIYDLDENTLIKNGKLEYTGFKKENNDGYKLVFYIKNTGTTQYTFEKKLYIEYFDDSNTFIGRSYADKIKEVSGGISSEYTIDLDNDIYNKATKLQLVLRTDDDYPNVTLNNKQLTCSNETNDIIYSFDDESKLTNIKDVYTYIKGEDAVKYSDDLVSYKTKISRLDSIDGVTAVLAETDQGFIATTLIDYKYADYSKLSSNTDYYIKETFAKTISFEMNAKGYSCR